MEILNREFAPAGQHDLDNAYNQVNVTWNNRGVTGMENSPRMKEMFVDLEYWIEEVYGKQRIVEGKVDAYKGTTKKWQILDDDCFDRDQIEKLQSATDSPMPDQLDEWKDKHNKPIMAPFNNENIKGWRDDDNYVDSGADFNPVQIGEQRKLN